MRKNKLIELLNNIHGNPEIVFWNGYVDDYMHISPDFIEKSLVKHTKEFFEPIIERECPQLSYPAKKAELERCVANQKWDLPNPFIRSKEEFESWYGKRKKKIIIINAVPRNKVTGDRLGTIEY